MLNSDVSEIFSGILNSLIISALILLPTVIILIISNIRLNNQNLPLRLHFRKLNKIYIYMAVLTYAVIEGIIIYNAIDTYNYCGSDHMNYNFFDSSGFGQMLIFLAIISLYALAIILRWFYSLEKKSEKWDQKKN